MYVVQTGLMCSNVTLANGLKYCLAALMSHYSMQAVSMVYGHFSSSVKHLKWSFAPFCRHYIYPCKMCLGWTLQGLLKTNKGKHSWVKNKKQPTQKKLKNIGFQVM